jgi:hypothetical protein
MNHQQRVYNLLSKVGNVSLKQERKVDMSMVNDLEIMIARLGAAITENNRSVSELTAAAGRVSDTAMDVLLMWEQVELVGEEVLSFTNELGVDAYSIQALTEYLQYTKGDSISNAKDWQIEADRLL